MKEYKAILYIGLLGDIIEGNKRASLGHTFNLCVALLR